MLFFNLFSFVAEFLFREVCQNRIIPAPPRQPSVGSPTMVIPGVPPPQSMMPVPSQVAQARPQRPPPSAAPQQMGTTPVFAPGTMPSTVMPAVSVIGAPLINPAGMIYAAPPPAFQVPVPQFTGAAAAQQVSRFIHFLGKLIVSQN